MNPPDFDPRTIPVSWSWLKAIECPALARFIASQPDGGEQTLAMRMGSGLAAEVLGTPYVVYRDGDRRGKRWDSFAEEHEGTLILTATEEAKVLGMAHALRDHPIAAPLLFGDGVEHEVPMEWTVNGRRYRTRGIDFIKRGHWIGELKQARTVKPGWFERDRLRELYPCQVELYDEGEAIVTGRDRDRHPLKKYIIGVEPKPPHLVTVFVLSPSAVAYAQRKVSQFRSRLSMCEASGQWPGYSLAEVPFEAPEESPFEDDGTDEETAADAGPIARWDGESWSTSATDPF